MWAESQIHIAVGELSLLCDETSRRQQQQSGVTNVHPGDKWSPRIRARVLKPGMTPLERRMVLLFSFVSTLWWFGRFFLNTRHICDYSMEHWDCMEAGCFMRTIPGAMWIDFFMCAPQVLLFSFVSTLWWFERFFSTCAV